MFGKNKKIEELEQRLKRQEQALALKNQYIHLQEKYISNVIDKAKIVQKNVFQNIPKINHFFSESFVFEQAKEVLNSHFYWCKKLPNGQLILIVIDTGEGDAATVFFQIQFYYLFNQLIDFQQITSCESILKSLQKEIESCDIGLAIFLIDGKNSSFCGNNMSFFYVQNEVVFLEKVEIQPKKIENIQSLYFYTSGIVEQVNHDDETQIYGEQKLLNFLNKEKNNPMKNQLLAWENELEEWMGCCGENTKNKLFIGIKL